MSSGTTVVVIVVILVLIALLGAAGISARRRRLRHQFGPEYDRVASEQNSKIKADAELTERQRRVRKLAIRPLPEEARIRYADRWVAIQEEFVDAPQSAVQDAYVLVTTVMRERGYPVDDEKQVMADLSVEHAQRSGISARRRTSARARPAGTQPPRICARRSSTTGRCSPTCSASRLESLAKPCQPTTPRQPTRPPAMGWPEPLMGSRRQIRAETATSTCLPRIRPICPSGNTEVSSDDAARSSVCDGR